MPAEPMYAVFPGLREMLRALSCILSRVEQFPAQAFGVRGGRGRLAVKVNPNSAAGVARLSVLNDWGVTFMSTSPFADMTAAYHPSAPAGPTPPAGPDSLTGPMRIVDVLDVPLEHLDVNRADDTPWQDMTYVVAVRDRAQAQAVLNVVTDGLARGIEARPIVGAGRSQPYLFWVVSGGQPPLTALTAKEGGWCRAWYGPVGTTRRGTLVFVEWPYKLNVARECLAQLDWGIDGGLLLLGQGEPRKLLISDPPSRRQPRLVDVGGVTDGGSPVVQLQCHEPAEGEDLGLRVRLRLVPDDTPLPLAQRHALLRDEVQAKTEALRRLEEDLEGTDPAQLPPYQPLYLYFAESGEAPADLRHLLVEWCGQPGLDSLRYAAIEGESLPPGLAPPGHRLHLLTTASALDGLRHDGAALWLREYAPGAFQGRAFRLLTDWAGFGLRLFLPDDGRRLDLYPRLPLETLAARKLGAALMGPDGGDWRDHCFLLWPQPDGRLSVYRLRRGDFRPLIDGLPWRCAIDVGPATLPASPPLADEVRAEMTRALTEALHDGAVDAVSGEWPSLAEAVGQRTKEMEGLRGELDGADALMDRIEQEMSDLERRREALIGRLLRVARTYEGAAEFARQAEEEARELRELAQRARQLRREYRRRPRPRS